MIYTYPHLNNRRISTRSNVQVRSPINSKSLEAENYKDVKLIEIITQNKKYQKLI